MFSISKYDIRAVNSQDEALDATADTRIKRIRTDVSYEYDVAWEMEDGRIVALSISTGSGCPTCGYGAGEQSWYVLTPKETAHA